MRVYGLGGAWRVVCVRGGWAEFVAYPWAADWAAPVRRPLSYLEALEPGSVVPVTGSWPSASLADELPWRVGEVLLGFMLGFTVGLLAAGVLVAVFG